jgi:transglutaminase-like putative cysteine protease
MSATPWTPTAAAAVVAATTAAALVPLAANGATAGWLVAASCVPAALWGTRRWRADVGLQTGRPGALGSGHAGYQAVVAVAAIFVLRFALGSAGTTGPDSNRVALLLVAGPGLLCFARSTDWLRAIVAASAAAMALTALVGLDRPQILPAWAGTALVAAALARSAADDGRPTLAGTPRSSSRVAIRAAAFAALALLVAPSVMAAVPPPSGSGRSSDQVRPGDEAAEGAALRPGREVDLGDRPSREGMDEVVLRVRAPVPALWRGQTFTEFDGLAWHVDEPLATTELPSTSYLPSAAAEAELIGPPLAPPELLVQEITVRARTSALVYGADRITTVAAPVPLVERSDGTILFGAPLGRGGTYTVRSLRVPATTELLRLADPRAGTPPPELDRFLAVPEHVDRRVRELAAELDAGAATTYDLVSAVETWLEGHTEYSLEVPPLPDGADPVAQHLFVDRVGWCEQIATSSAVLLRLAGVPTRLATGFAPGSRSWFDPTFTVRGRDAHAWIEVWFPGVGWQGFDPTADVPLAGEAEPHVVARLLDILREIVPWVIGAVAVVGAAVALVRWRNRWLDRRRRSWARATVDRVDRLGRRHGRPRAPSETPMEHARVLVDASVADARLVDVATTVGAAAYGGAPAHEAVRKRISEVLDELDGSLVDRARLRMRRRRPQR